MSEHKMSKITPPPFILPRNEGDLLHKIDFSNTSDPNESIIAKFDLRTAPRTYNPDKLVATVSLLNAWQGKSLASPPVGPEYDYERALKDSGLPPFLGGPKQNGPLPPARG